MYPKRVKIQEVGVALDEFERKWVKMEETVKDPEERMKLLKMAAVMKLVPESLAGKAELLWDDIKVDSKGIPKGCW